MVVMNNNNNTNNKLLCFQDGLHIIIRKQLSNNNIRSVLNMMFNVYINIFNIVSICISLKWSKLSIVFLCLLFIIILLVQ